MIAAVIERLRALCPDIKLVQGAAGMQAAVERNPTADPAAFVFRLGETASPNEVANLVEQRVVAEISVMLVVRHVGDAVGGSADDDLGPLRDGVKAALLGWSPGKAFSPIERSDSRLMAFTGGYMWWQDTYVTDYYDRSIEDA